MDELKNNPRQKIPGSEKLTRPEELTYLSKFLKCVKEVQTEITKDTVINSKLIKDSGHFPEISELNNVIIEPDKSVENNVTLSNNISTLDVDSKVELNNNIYKLQIKELDSLKDSIKTLEDSRDIELDNSIFNLKDVESPELNNDVSLINIDKSIENLGETLEKILVDKEPVLTDKIYNIKNKSEIIELGENLETINDSRGDIDLDQSIEKLIDRDRELFLSKDIVNLQTNNNIEDLGDYIQNLSNINDVGELSNTIEKINYESNQELNEEFISIGKSPKEIDIKDYRSSLNVDDKTDIKDYRSSLNVDKEIDINDYVNKLEVEENDSAYKKINENFISKNTLNNEIVGLSDLTELIEPNNTSREGFHDWDDDIIVHRENLSPNDISKRDFKKVELDDTIIKNTVESEVEKLGEDVENIIEDTSFNMDKYLLQRDMKTGKVDDNNWLFNLVINMLDAVPSSKGTHLGYSHNSIDRWKSNLKTLVSLYLSGEVTEKTYIDFENAMEPFYEEVERKNLLRKKEWLVPDKYSNQKTGVIERYFLENNSKRRINRSENKKPDVPRIGQGDFFQTAKQYGVDTLKYVIRKRAEEIISNSDFLDDNEKERALTETLLYLSQFSDYCEIAAGTHIGLLPGDRNSTKYNNAKKIINSIWKTAGGVVNTVKSAKNAKSTFSKVGAIVVGTVKTGADAIASLVDTTGSIKNRPKLKLEKNENKGRSGLKRVLGGIKEGISSAANFLGIHVYKGDDFEESPTDYEVANHRPRLPQNVSRNPNKYLGLNKTKIDIPYGTLDKDFDINSNSYGKGNLLNFKNEYVSSEGILLTLHDLCDVSLDKDPIPDSLSKLKQLLIDSPYITTVGKFGEHKKGGFATYTLSDNSYWDILIEPFTNDRLNGGWSYLPAIEEINLINQRLHGVHTGYSKWVPVSNFDFDRAKLVTKSAALYEGEIVYPVSAEMMNDLRITVIDDQYKSWSGYFRKCMEVAVYNSIPHKGDYYDDNKRYSSPLLPTYVDRSSPATALYKNITFRIRIYVMTPQYSTIKSFDLLCVLKDFQEIYTGTVDAGGAPDIDLTFSVVGENPDAYQVPADYYRSTKDVLLKSLRVATDSGAITRMKEQGEKIFMQNPEYRRYIESEGRVGTRPTPEELRDYLDSNKDSIGSDNKTVTIQSEGPKATSESSSNNFTVPPEQKAEAKRRKEAKKKKESVSVDNTFDNSDYQGG